MGIVLSSGHIKSPTGDHSLYSRYCLCHRHCWMMLRPEVDLQVCPCWIEHGNWWYWRCLKNLKNPLWTREEAQRLRVSLSMWGGMLSVYPVFYTLLITIIPFLTRLVGCGRSFEAWITWTSSSVSTFTLTSLFPLSLVSPFASESDELEELESVRANAKISAYSFSYA